MAVTPVCKEFCTNIFLIEVDVKVAYYIASAVNI